MYTYYDLFLFIFQRHPQFGKSVPSKEILSKLLKSQADRQNNLTLKTLVSRKIGHVELTWAFFSFLQTYQKVGKITSRGKRSTLSSKGRCISLNKGQWMAAPSVMEVLENPCPGDQYVPSHFSHIQLFVTLRTLARQAPLSTGFSRQEYWSGLPWPPPGNCPNPGIKPVSLTSPALAGGFFITSSTWEAQWTRDITKMLASDEASEWKNSTMPRAKARIE